MANLNWCRTCGKEYPVCPHCEQDARLNPWRMICDTEPHFLVWTAVNQYRQGIISKETAKADLTTLLMRKYKNVTEAEVETFIPAVRDVFHSLHSLRYGGVFSLRLEQGPRTQLQPVMAENESSSDVKDETPVKPVVKKTSNRKGRA